MTASIDPLVTSRRVSTSYERYLTTFLPLKDPALRTGLMEAVRARDVMTKGPFLEASPPYARGATIADLVDEKVLSPEFLNLCSPALPKDRALYRHQETAIRKAALGRSLVVATGTGSGKTESFLVPILDSLCREHVEGRLGPGTRALLLYPMNALANDQVKRLRELLADYPHITFGRYTGETEEDPRRAEELFAQVNPDTPRLPNELISRKAMRDNPPHILLTNYAMLEYLLLRPADMDLFEGQHGGHWRWLAIDEAHVYSGSLGSEIAMLLRRLRDRVSGGQDMQAILTSATVGSDSASVSAFASNLSDAEVEWDPEDVQRQDIVAATRRELPAHGSWALADLKQFDNIVHSQDSTRALLDVAKANGWSGDNAGDALAAEDHVVSLRRTLATAPQTIQDLTGSGPGDPSGWTASALAACVKIASEAKDSSGTAVLNARYHLFAKAAEGAFTCLGDNGPHVSLTRHERCDQCDDPAFEIGACSRCGHVYLCGRVEATSQGDRLIPAPRSDLHAMWFMLDPASEGSEGAVMDEDDAVLANDESETAPVHFEYLCVTCGLLDQSPGACTSTSCTGQAPRRVQRLLGGRSSKERCMSCGRQAADLVRPFSTGNDAAAAVLATALYQEIPTAGIDNSRPGEGRKLLLFSDSRQAASFFASYLETSFSTIRRRSLVLEAIPTAVDGEGGPAYVEDVITEVAKAGLRHQLFNRRDSRQAREATSGLWVLQELLSLDDRQSLEGLGQISIRLARDPSWPEPEPLLQLGLTSDEAWALLETLVQTLRTQGALSMPESVASDDEVFSPRRGPIYVRGEASESKLKVLSWLPSRLGTTNRRLSYLERVLRALGADETAARSLLEGCWRFLTAVIKDGWLLTSHHRSAGVVMQVDHTWLRMDTVPPGAPIFRCEQCHRFATTSVRNVCPAMSCEGALVEVRLPLATDDTNHYRDLHRNIMPMGMSVREHTAQWISTKAAEIQQQFVKGEVNVLSCSTTFELGVDVGELEGVMMRNVPPTTANYLQRAGRAGRRTSSAAVVLTFAQRRPHDLARFLDPVQMISGEVRAPYVHLDNDRIDRRHAHSVALAHFFRDRWTTTNVQWRRVGEFFLEGAPTGADQLLSYLEDPPTEVVDTLRAILPESVIHLIGVHDGSWADVLSRLVTEVGEQLKHDVAEFDDLREIAHRDRKDFLAARYGKVVSNLRDQQLLGLLAQRNILPKYGFPVDTVDMRTMFTEANAGSSVQLTRDLSTAIYEYAPGAQVVAGGQLWTSGGIYRMPGKDLEVRHYAVCKSCGHYEDQVTPLDPQCPACSEARPRSSRYAKPVYGFVAARKVGRPGTRPPQRAWRGSTHVRQMSPDSRDHRLAVPLGDLTIASGPRGQLVAISEGAMELGFWICDWCGWGESVDGKPPKKHRSPMRDQECTGPLQQLRLGHTYETDVMRLSGGPWADEALASPSVLYALLEGASRELDIARDDIDGTLHMAEDRRPALVLFDTVAGGAGNVLRVAADFEDVAGRALSLVVDCECGPETSCFACLRTYSNDRYHEQLHRDEAAALLRQFIST